MAKNVLPASDPLEMRMTKQKLSNSDDMLSNLPDPLLCKILSYLSTMESVRTSVLSNRWRNLWLDVPVLDLDSNSFPNNNVFVSFVSKLLGSENKQHLERFKLLYHVADHDASLFNSVINAVIRRGVCHFDVHNKLGDVGHNDDYYLDDADVGDDDNDEVKMPLSLYTCQSLVNLQLHYVVLDNPEFVSLPCVKILHLHMVKYEADSTLESLISSCQVLEELTIIRYGLDSLKTVRVCSLSLKSFNFRMELNWYKVKDHVVEIDAPKLEYMHLIDLRSDNFIIHNIGPSTKVNIDVNFNAIYMFGMPRAETTKITMFGKFLTGISTVVAMIVSHTTLDVIHVYCRRNQLPQFHNLSRLHVCFNNKTKWSRLPKFFGSCPNLCSLVLEFVCSFRTASILSSVPQYFISSLEYVHLIAHCSCSSVSSWRSYKKKLAKYFLENASALKKLTLSSSFLGSIREIKSYPRSSTRCEVVIV